MTKKLNGKQASMFDALAKKSTSRIQSPQPNEITPAPLSEPEQQKAVSQDAEPSANKQQRKRAKTGKRSDPTYTQVGCYLPRDLNNRVKVKLVGDSRDFSDLAAELLEQWLSD